MANPGSAHNDWFLASFENVRDAAAELRSSLPKALAEQVQWETLKPASGSFTDETVRWSHSDKLYEVRYGEQDALLYVLWEHKSEVEHRSPRPRNYRQSFRSSFTTARQVAPQRRASRGCSTKR